MPFSSIDKPSKYFDTKLYTGNGSSQSITGLSFSPDFVWVKDRTSANSNNLSDIVRGATKTLFTDATNAEVTDATRLTSFNSDGFSVGSSGSWNTNTNTYVSWNWDANGAGVSNTSGTITSTVSANTTSGFSIVSYTGTGSAGTVGHGLGAVPAMIIIKNRDSSVTGWITHHKSFTTAGNFLLLQSTNAVATNTGYYSSAPSSTLINLGASGYVNEPSEKYIAYCFAEVKGYSKFGSYKGNGSTDGTFVYTGFKPAWVMVKKTNASGTNWQLIDNKRSDANGNNIIDKVLSPNASDADYDEGSSAWCGDLLSNGFKWRGNWGALNNSGDTYIYAAFAENPFVSSKGIPCTAR